MQASGTRRQQRHRYANNLEHPAMVERNQRLRDMGWILEQTLIDMHLEAVAVPGAAIEN